jgi:hypothetical protein
MKVKAFWGILMLTLVMLLGACAPTAPPLVGCKAELSQISLLRSGSPLAGYTAGSDLLAIKAVFTISNPNPYEVGIEGLTYRLDTGQGPIVYDEIPYRYFIPAGEKITLEGTGTLLFMDIFMEKFMIQGLSKAMAAGVSIPIWKGLGGIKPEIIPKEVWDALPAKPVTYSYETSIYTKAQGMQAWQSVKGVWPPPSAQPPAAQPPAAQPPAAQPPAVVKLSFEAAEYSNADLGFSVKYPKDWAKQPSDALLFYAAAPAQVPVLFVDAKEAATFAEALKKSIEGAGGTGFKVVSEKESALADGTKASTAVFEGTLKGYGAKGFALGVQKGNKWILVTVGTVELLVPYDEAKFSEIVHTLQFKK